jgi:glycosyltransferase involved in cell wall biosynthesis
MRIIHIIPNLGSGGAERLAVDLTNELSKVESIEQIFVLTFAVRKSDNDNFYLDELSKDIKYINVKVADNVLGKLIRAIKILNKIIKIKPDVVHLHLAGSLISSLLAVILYRRPKYIQTLHSTAEYHHKKMGVPLFLEKFIYKFFIDIYAISDENEISFRKLYKCETKGVIYNGRSGLVVSSKFNNERAFVNSLKTGENTILFLNVARCHKVKNHRLLIKSFNRLIRNGYDAILIIVGNGFDSKLGCDLKEISCDKVYFLGEKKNVADFYFLADAFCLSSLYEGMPITLTESLYFGVTPICTPISGAIDICKEGIGYISEGFEEDSFYFAMEKFIFERNLIDKEKIIQLFNERFSIKKCMESYLNIYKEVQK